MVSSATAADLFRLPSRFALGAGVCTIVDLGQMLEIQMCIHLSRTNVRMTQQLLHGAHITA